MYQLDAPAAAMDDAIAHHIDRKTKPPGSLGRIEALAFQIARIQQNLAPVMERCTLLIFAGDHGITAQRVSKYPQSVTRQMVLNFLAGGAAANVFARSNGVALQVVDAGIAGVPIDDPGLLCRRIGPGTRDASLGAAMTPEQRALALRHGYALGAALPGEAAVFGEMGIGNTSSAALVAHKLTGIPLVRLCGRGTGLDDEELRHKHAVLARAAARTGADPDVDTVLHEYGGFEIVMMAGAMLGAARAGRIVVVDGFIATVAALAAIRYAPALREYLVFAHRSAEAGHAVLLEFLEAEPLLHLEMCLGEGTGGVLAWPLLRAAAALLRDMASFESAGVSDA